MVVREIFINVIWLLIIIYPTETYFSSKFKLSSPYHHVPKASNDFDDWDFRKFRAYGPCTKKFDKKKNELKNFEDVFN